MGELQKQVRPRPPRPTAPVPGPPLPAQGGSRPAPPSPTAAQALRLYRRALHAIHAKPEEARGELRGMARAEMERGRGADRRNLQHVEYLLRRGWKQVQVLESPSVTSGSLSR